METDEAAVELDEVDEVGRTGDVDRSGGAGRSAGRGLLRRGISGTLVVLALIMAASVVTTAATEEPAEAIECGRWYRKAKGDSFLHPVDWSVQIQHMRSCRNGSHYVRARICNHRPSGKSGRVWIRFQGRDRNYDMPSVAQGCGATTSAYRARRGESYWVVAHVFYNHRDRVVAQTEWDFW